jgi:hypothetical protein
LGEFGNCQLLYVGRRSNCFENIAHPEPVPQSVGRRCPSYLAPARWEWRRQLLSISTLLGGFCCGFWWEAEMRGLCFWGMMAKTGKCKGNCRFLRCAVE